MTIVERILAYTQAAEKHDDAVLALLESLVTSVTDLERSHAALSRRLEGLEKTLHDRTDHLA